MKKTMFITSVIMVVVMAIALTTSSLAWFTATGSPSVTTSALTLTAKANASTGIQISATSAAEGWDIVTSLNGVAGVAGTTKIDLNSVNGADSGDTNGMMPVLPLSGQTVDDWDDDLDAAGKKAAMLNGLGNQGGNASFCGNTISTITFDGTPYTNGYFVDEIWITNTASGAGAAAVSITPSCAFYDQGTTNVYTPVTTNPNLYVAVLAANGPAIVNGTTNYEIVNIFNSKGSAYVNIGKTATEFADEATVADCYYMNVPIADVIAASGTTTFTLPAAVNGAAFGEARIFKIVAWYDATTLNNNNSGFDIDFVLTFSAS